MATKKQKDQEKKSATFGKQKRKVNNVAHAEDGSAIINSKIKTDIIAAVLITVGVALFALALVPTDAPVSAVIINALRFLVGIGIYIFPIGLIIFGSSFFFRMERQKISTRLCIGLSLIIVAVLALVSLSSPAVAANKPQALFDQANIVNYGGIIGSSIAWIGVTLLGSLVSTILLSGVIVVGFIVIGLSITKIISRINQRREDIEKEHEEKQRAKLIAQANSENGKYQADDGQQTIALLDNASKKPGLKTRILGFTKDNKKDSEDDFQFAPNQNKTRVLEGSDNKAAKEDKPQTDETFKKTKVLDSDIEDKKPALKAKDKPETNSVSIKDDGFILPSFDLLKIPDSSDVVVQSQETLKKTAESLNKTLEDFGIKANVVGWVPGPTVTLFKVDLPAGVRVSRITALNDDIALALAAPGVRVFAPIPGTTYVGIEVPNEKRQTVYLSEILSKAKKGPLQMSIGKDVEGNAVLADLAKMPHLLIGGTTGSGKSVSINAMIMSILMRATPSEVRLILIDPKRVEFTPYNDIPHLYVPVVTEPKEAASALAWGVAEMESRLKTFSEHKVRNIDAFNKKVQNMSEKKRRELGLNKLPYIVIVIDELADLMMAVGKEVEFSISRIAQLARAAGIHLIVATQRPSTNIVTGLIKANITCRIAFNVASGIDSRVILDTGGAESLIGLGDLLFNKPEFSKPLRVQGCFVDEDEVFALVDHLKKQGSPEYHNDILKTNLICADGASGTSFSSGANDDDALFWEAAEMIVNAQHGSTSSLQRRFKIGYSRAGRIMDMLEEKGIVGPQNGSKPREVLVDSLELEGIKALESNPDVSFEIETESEEDIKISDPNIPVDNDVDLNENDSEEIHEDTENYIEDEPEKEHENNHTVDNAETNTDDTHDDVLDEEIEEADSNDINFGEDVNNNFSSEQLVEEDIE